MSESNTDSSIDSSEVESIDEDSTNATDEDFELHEDDNKNEASKPTYSQEHLEQTSLNGTVNSNIEIPETDCEDDSEEEVVPMNRKRYMRILESDESSDDEDKLRKSLYEAETDDEDHQPPIEDKAYSKTTRRSINGFLPRRSAPPNLDDSSDDDVSGSIISEEEENEKLETEAKENENSSSSDKVLSSTLRSPLKDISETNRQSYSNHSFNSSNGTKMSSTVSVKDESDLLDEAAGGVSFEKVKVSPSEYEAEVAAKEKLECEIEALKKGLGMNLPDGGEKLKRRIKILLEEVDQKRKLLSTLEIDVSKSIRNEITRSFQSDIEDKSSISVENYEFNNIVAPVFKVDDVKPVYLGKVGMKNFTNQKTLTVEKLENIQQSIAARPAETVFESAPKHLKLTLMSHQLHALAFMLWREKQNPRGGFLADDMGLGKTMTTISLILKRIQSEEEDEEEESSSDEEESADQEWKARGRKDLRDGGTLVVCPASLLKQWEAEIKSRVKRGAIEYYVFHGANREYKARQLAKYDVVLTTYQLVATEEKNNGCLFQIKWNRIVLDEGHVIRNHKSKQSEAVCKLSGKYRWLLTGTPIHNKEFDLYAAIKFLRCKPFDDLHYWRHWIETKGRDSSPRVQALLKAIMLRRTKQGLIETGEIQSLPEKVYKQFNVKLNAHERIVYNRFMAFSKHIFATFVQQQQDKNGNFVYDKDRLGRLYQKFSNKFKQVEEVKAHQILTLLLRLRQICCHTGLAKSGLDVLDTGELSPGEETEHHDESDGGLLKQLENLSLNEHDGDGTQIDNVVFNLDVPSSKILHMMDVFRKTLTNSDDKAIIVSQWTSYLNIIRGMLEIEGIRYCELNGTVPVKDRNDIVVKFNNPNSGIKVMLLSLTAGGVGLNLVGANYLFLMDLHWNPQLEQQAQDRIYRFGQTKQVNVFKFICDDTIEEQIQKIQEVKLNVATASLTGAKNTAGSKLTMNELKMLFGMQDV